MLLLFAGAFTARAQVCKILISYDDSGNRIKREKSCIGLRPADTATNPLAVADNSDSAGQGGAWSAMSFEVYPNPATNLVHIRLKGIPPQFEGRLILSDATGKTLNGQTIRSAQATVDLSPYADGTYFLILTDNNKASTVKVVKSS
ncbi:T9SS type A sorting domain-containing protein [Taibaiella koreensis]|uniref:T9SS type A sorting domain-containing protein n=1 Tax=Taibaiella koreensis TaxID=1268548 RepID=UPI0013C31BB6|nr:T9SS type A sorting domain-containing protein [Taibaiella koreensis]